MKQDHSSHNSSTTLTSSSDDPLDEVSPSDKKTYLNGFLRLWWLELVSILLMLFSLAAIVITVALHQNQPLPRWPFSITINALLSIYGTIFKGTMMLVVAETLCQLKWTWFSSTRPLQDLDAFDMASRGPKGAAELVWFSRKRLKQAIIPVLGAILTLIAVFVDPFTQQIVRYYSCLTENQHGVQATITRANEYSPSRSYGFDTTDFDTILFKTVIEAFTDEKPLNGTKRPFFCPSGHCNFLEYWSIGVCSKCERLKVIITQKGSDVLRVHLEDHYAMLNIERNLTSRHYTVFTFGSWDYGQNIGKLATTGIEACMIAALPPLKDSLLDKDGTDLNFLAARCRIYPCIQKFKSSVQVGLLKETLLESKQIPQDSVTKRRKRYLRATCLSHEEWSEYILPECKLSTPEATGWLRMQCVKPNKMATLPSNQSCIFSYDQLDWYNTAGYIAGGSQLMDTTASPLKRGNLRTNSYKEAVGNRGPTYLRYIYNNGKVTFERIEQIFGSLAYSLTTRTRLHNRFHIGTENAGPAVGIMLENSTCLEVRWYWLVVPILLFLSTTMLFTMTIWSTRKVKGVVWKSSSLALLFHGLHRQTRDVCGQANSIRDMEKVSKKLWVQMQLTDEGWRFCDPDIEVEKSLPNSVVSNREPIETSNADKSSPTYESKQDDWRDITN